MNTNRIRRIAKARFGLSIPSGNPYMTTNGLAIPGNSITQYNLLGTDYGTEFSNRVEQIMAPTNSLIDSYAKAGDLFSLKLQNDRNTSGVITQRNTVGVNTPIDTSTSSEQLFQKLGGWNTVGQVADFADSLLFGGQRVYNSPVANGFRQGYDFISNNVSPQLSLWMKGAKFVGNGLSSLGLKSDYNIFNGIPIAENFTSIGAKKSHNLVINKDAIEKGGGSYTGTIINANKIQPKAGKSFSIFNSGSRRHTNRTVDALNDQFVDMGRVMDKATDMASMATNMSDLNHMQYESKLNGDYDQRYMRAKFGAKLKRVKKINFRKQGGEIVGAINLDNWQPVITEAVEQFENGGELEWTPVITLQEGEKTEKVDGITGAAPKITFQYWYDTVPKDRLSNNYDLKKAFEVLPFEELEAWRKSSDEDLRIGKNHLRSIYQLPNGDYEFLKLGNEQSNPEVHFETDTYHSGENGLKDSHDLVFEKDRYFYRRKPKQFKNGGKPEPIDAPEIEETNQKNLIPEGALHAHKHHMENADNLTKKGIPVIDNEGEQQAEIEREEILFTLEVTKALEDLYSKYFNENSTQKDKDEAAIEAGKLLVYEILYNTDDRTNLISKCKEGGVLNGIK